MVGLFVKIFVEIFFCCTKSRYAVIRDGHILEKEGNEEDELAYVLIHGYKMRIESIHRTRTVSTMTYSWVYEI